MTTYPAPMCLGCKHLRRDEARACDAFPDGIPLTIWHSAVDHRQAVDGDHGVRYEPESERDEAYVEHVFPAAHEHRFVAERCLVCGCSEPRNPHDEHLPILQPDAPLSVAPHADEKQQQLALTTCPTCGKSAQDVTDTGYWYTGMVCPQCGHAFTASDERVAVLDVLRSLKADVTRAIEGEVMRPFIVAAMEPHETRHNRPVFGAGHKIIGNIGDDGVFHPIGEEEPHAHASAHRGPEAEIEWRDPHSLIPYHPVQDEDKLQGLTVAMEQHGWVGKPLVRWDDYLLTGAHRSQAAKAADLEHVPTVDLPDVFREAGLDFESLWHEEGEPTIDESSQLAYLIAHLPADVRAKYGIDIQ